MDENQFRVLMAQLARIHIQFKRMADAAETQVKETKAMREMVVERQREERQ